MTGEQDTPPGIDERCEMVQRFGHDMRAAVSDVIGGLRLIDLDRLDPETQSQIRRMRIAGETLAELVEAALLAASGEAMPRTGAEHVDLGGFLTALDLRWSGQAAERGAAFRVQVAGAVPDRIGVPRVALDRILGNLIGNALRHGGTGPIRVEAVLAADDTLRLMVTDSGPGFPNAQLARAAAPAPRADTAGRPGSGLGLHIARELAAEIGGRIVLDNRDRGGARAMLELPEAAWKPGAALDRLPSLNGLRVLVAEDNETNQFLVRQMLTQLGGEMVLARDGIEALDALDREQFDIALIDIEMPRLSGIEVMRHLRGHPDGPAGMPLVALTAYVLRDNREAIYAAGADGIIAKPIRSVASLGDAILRHVTHALPDADRPPADAWPMPPGEPLDRARFEALLEAAGPAGRAELLTHLLEDLRTVAQTLSGDPPGAPTEVIRAQTHILISLAGAIGADRLQRLAEALNAAAHRRREAELAALMATCLRDLDAVIALVAAHQGAG